MGYGQLDAKQREVLRPFVYGKTVHDLGAGDLELAGVLLDLGAQHVHAYDKLSPPRHLPVGITYKHGHFHDLLGPFPTIFLSWPQNIINAPLTQFALDPGCKRLIYLGNNFDGSSCGHPDLFTAMIQRELLAYVPTRKNSLIVVGDLLATSRTPTPEEQAGISMYNSGILAYESIEGAPIGAERVLSEVPGTVVAENGDSLLVRLSDQNLTVHFPRNLLSDAVSASGTPITYQIILRPDGTRFQRFVPRAEALNQDRLAQVHESLASIRLRTL